MQDKIDEAIKALSQLVIDSNKSTPETTMKLTQSITNLTHAKLNLLQYDKEKPN